MRFRAEQLLSCFSRKSIFSLLLAVGLFALACHAASDSKFDSREEEIADAIKKNGVIFDNWPKPEFCLVFSGNMDGYLEPCGCAGLDNQLGGMKRRHTFLKQLQEQGWNPLAFDMGGEVRRTGPQAEIKYGYAVRSLMESGYQAIAIGYNDLRISNEALLYVFANIEADKNPLLSANVDLYGMAKPIIVVERAGQRIGVTSVLGSKFRALLEANSEIEISDPVEALAKVAPQLAAEKCDLEILLVHGDPDEAAELARKFPQFDFVSTTGGAETPPDRSKPIEGTDSYLIETGKKGQYVAVVAFYNDSEMPIRYQRVPLDHRFVDSQEMQKLFVQYQDELRVKGLEGLGLTGTKHPVDSFAGSDVCADCHTQATEIFNETPHAHATDTLVGLNPPRQYDPECLSCHVTGWHPQEYFPYASGYKDLKQTPLMVGNGCENCHGPGAAHVAAESGEEILQEAEIEDLRARMRLKIGENEGNMGGQKTGVVVDGCLQCHDIDNSPDFDFQEYWPAVEHYGKD